MIHRSIALWVISVFGVGMMLTGCQNANQVLTEKGVVYEKNAYAQDNPFKVFYRPSLNKIIIPTQVMFMPQSHKINMDHFSVLEEIYGLHQAHPDMIFTIKVYTDAIKKSDWATGDTYTQIQAEVLASTLWSMGMPESQIRYQGMENAHPVASNQTSAGSAMNRRIEIEMEVNDEQVV